MKRDNQLPQPVIDYHVFANAKPEGYERINQLPYLLKLTKSIFLLKLYIPPLVHSH